MHKQSILQALYPYSDFHDMQVLKNVKGLEKDIKINKLKRPIPSATQFEGAVQLVFFIFMR